jgi:transcriptional regulator with XRE-family HTH domain
MVARGRKKPVAEQPVDEPGDGTLDVNAVVSYNIRAIRERRGMTQTGVAERLAQLTGHLLPQASISAMERGFDGERRRRFDAHELYLLSMVFDVPIAYFFIPPPGLTGVELADTRRPVAELYRSLLGTDAQLEEMDRRLDDIKIQNPDGTDDVLTALFGADAGAGNWHQHFRTWRAERLREVEREYGTQLDEVADFLADFAAKIKAVGPSGFLQSMDWQEGDRPPLDGEE